MRVGSVTSGLRVCVAIAMTSIALACTAHREGTADPAADETTGRLPAPILTTYDHCMIDALRKRKTAEDDCLAECFERGTGRNVGGGCYHICFAYRDDRDLGAWTQPEAWQACEVLRPKSSEHSQ